MIRISRLLGTALSLVLVLAAAPVSSDTALQRPIIELTSTALFTFSREERAVRVAAVFTAKDSAVVPTLVRFLDQHGNVLKQVRGDLSEGNAVVAELTRAEVAGRGDLLVRVEVLHKFQGLRRERYSILVSAQPIGPTGSGSIGIFWPGGRCGIPLPPGTVPGEPLGDGTAVMCNPPAFTDF